MADNHISVLDHGHVNLVESWGSDERIIEAARMSTAKGFQGWGPAHSEECNAGEGRAKSAGKLGWVCICSPKSGDEKLLAYLWRNKHHTPFEMAGITVEIQAPIFVFREWHRHRTQSYNELSARYTPLPDINYMPTVERLTADGGSNKQAASTGKSLSPAMAEWFRKSLEIAYGDAERLYRAALEEGTPKELARLIVPVGRYSRMRASANLRNWLAFMTLRCAPNAQWEIRQYAEAVSSLIARQFPRTHALWQEGNQS